MDGQSMLPAIWARQQSGGNSDTGADKLLQLAENPFQSRVRRGGQDVGGLC